jgi:hypothetical protein
MIEYFNTIAKRVFGGFTIGALSPKAVTLCDCI